ncbi:hypothetical protein V6Z11_D06G146900 [Gossypium hirsutum]
MLQLLPLPLVLICNSRSRIGSGQWICVSTLLMLPVLYRSKSTVLLLVATKEIIDFIN